MGVQPEHMLRPFLELLPELTSELTRAHLSACTLALLDRVCALFNNQLTLPLWRVHCHAARLSKSARYHLSFAELEQQLSESGSNWRREYLRFHQELTRTSLRRADCVQLRWLFRKKHFGGSRPVGLSGSDGNEQWTELISPFEFTEESWRHGDLAGAFQILNVCAFMGCEHCDKDTNVDNVATLRCSRCKQVWYCDSQCQRRHWKQHKLKCKPAQSRALNALPRTGQIIRCENPEPIRKVYPYDDYTVERMDDGEWILEHRIRSMDLDNDSTIVESKKMLMSYSGVPPAALLALWADTPNETNEPAAAEHATERTELPATDDADSQVVALLSANVNKETLAISAQDEKMYVDQLMARGSSWEYFVDPRKDYLMASFSYDGELGGYNWDETAQNGEWSSALMGPGAPRAGGVSHFWALGASAVSLPTTE